MPAASEQAILAAIRSFDPDLVFYRPVADRPDLHRVALAIIRDLRKPWVVWMMDDWPERLRITDPKEFAVVERELRALLDGAADRLAISESMADAFQIRYGVPFKVFHNGVNPEEWPAKISDGSATRPVVVRYAGGLGVDTTRDSVLEVARALADIAKRVPVTFEIRTQENWLRSEAGKYEVFPHTAISVADLTPADYRRWLAEADILILAYNFDDDTRRYLRYSFANKMPEYLASGAAVLAYGPREIATIDFLAKSDAAVVVEERDPGKLAGALEVLAADSAARKAVADKARAVAFGRLALKPQIEGFIEALAIAAGTRDFRSVEMSQADHVQLDEVRVVFEILKEQPEGVMIDVGAHFGASLAQFAGKGWKVYAFEPDPGNRKRLLENHGSNENVVISGDAVAGFEQAGGAVFQLS